MYKRKQCYINILIFTTSFVIFMLLFSIDNKQVHNKLIPNNENIESNRLFDLNFEYLINNEVCNDTGITGVIIVTSYYGNIETRSAMRRAFSTDDLHKSNLRRVFLLGVETNHTYINDNAIHQENDRYGDLIQGNFKEAYRNLTYKHTMGLKWVSEYCRHAKYVMKMDDDIVLNMYELPDTLNHLKPLKTLLAGYIFLGMVPIREPNNKWFVTYEEYSDTSYPPFLSGWFYITTPYVASLFYQLSQRTKYFWIDDVYITGVLAKSLKLKHLDLRHLFTVHPEQLRCCMENVLVSNTSCSYIVGPNGNDNNLFYKFNRVMSKCYPHKCLNDLNDTRCSTKKVTKLLELKSFIKTVKL